MSLHLLYNLVAYFQLRALVPPLSLAFEHGDEGRLIVSARLTMDQEVL